MSFKPTNALQIWLGSEMTGVLCLLFFTDQKYMHPCHLDA